LKLKKKEVPSNNQKNDEFDGAPYPENNSPMGNEDPMMGDDQEMGNEGQMMGDPKGNGGPDMDGDPMMGDGQNMDNEDPMMGDDQNMDNEDPMMGDDQNMDNEDPMMGDGQDMGGDESGNDDSDDSTISIIKQLSPRDKEAVRAYAKSMLNNSNEDNNISESFIFTKKQLSEIMENFNDTEEKENENMRLKNNKPTVSKKSPFNSPKFS
jgi:hypothetical protein